MWRFVVQRFVYLAALRVYLSENRLLSHEEVSLVVGGEVMMVMLLTFLLSMLCALSVPCLLTDICYAFLICVPCFLLDLWLPSVYVSVVVVELPQTPEDDPQRR